MTPFKNCGAEQPSPPSINQARPQESAEITPTTDFADSPLNDAVLQSPCFVRRAFVQTVKLVPVRGGVE